MLGAVTGLLSDAERLALMRHAAVEMDRPGAAYDIWRQVKALADRGQGTSPTEGSESRP